MFVGFYVSAVMAATINNRSIADTEAHVADVCTRELGSKGNLLDFLLTILILIFISVMQGYKHNMYKACADASELISTEPGMKKKMMNTLFLVINAYVKMLHHLKKKI
jgi:hypothetical protein